MLYDITVQAGETKKYSLTDGSYIVSVSDGVTTENVKLRILLALRTDIVKEYFTAFCSNCECSGTTQKYVSEDYKNLLKEPIAIQYTPYTDAEGDAPENHSESYPEAGIRSFI